MFPTEPLPDKIGTYKVVRRLSGTGAVEAYLGRSEGPMGFQRDCVLKLMADTSEGSAQFAEELAREAAICSRLTHPNIVRMFDFFEHDRKLVLVLEYSEGITLHQLVEHLAEKHKKLGDPAIYHIGHQIAGALAHAHAATDEKGKSTPIIHRSLHPDNILVALDGYVRLTGFGVGKILGRTPDTALGTVKGRPGYMAPEQARGEPVTTKADIYGLGLLLWSLFTGRQPPDDGSWPARIGTLRSDLPREIVAMLDAALDRFPGTRKITARDMEQWLAKIVPADKGKADLKAQVLAHRDELLAADPDEPTGTFKPTNALSALLRASADPDGPTRPIQVGPPPQAPPIPPLAGETTARFKIPPPPPPNPPFDGETTSRFKVPPAPPAGPNSAPPVRFGEPPVRFGEPPPGLPPAPPLPPGDRKEDWRHSLPDVNNLDQIFEEANASRPTGARGSTPDPTPTPPPAAAAIPAPPQASSRQSSTDVFQAAPAPGPKPASPGVAPPLPRPTSRQSSTELTAVPPRPTSRSSSPGAAPPPPPLPPRPPSRGSSTELTPAPPRPTSRQSDTGLTPVPPRPTSRQSDTGLTPAPPRPTSRQSDTGLTPAPPRPTSRQSDTGLTPVAPKLSPKPASPPAVPAPPKASSTPSNPGVVAIPGPPNRTSRPITLLGMPPAPIATPPAPPVATPPTPPAVESGSPSLLNIPPAPPLIPSDVPPPLPSDAPPLPSDAPPLPVALAAPAVPAAPLEPISLGLAPEPVPTPEPPGADLNRAPIPPAPPMNPGVAPAARPPPPFMVAETLPPPPEDERSKDRSTLPWKDTQLGPRAGAQPDRLTSPHFLRWLPQRFRPLGTTIVVSACTATLVVVVALSLFIRRSPTPAATNGPAATGTSAATLAASATRAPAKPPPPPPAPPPPAASAAPSAIATARPADLPSGLGYLVATFPTPADVYVSGKILGPANEPLKVSCGRWFVRIATPGGGKYPEWVSAGQTVNVACQNTTSAAFKPAPGSANKR